MKKILYLFMYQSQLARRVTSDALTQRRRRVALPPSLCLSLSLSLCVSLSFPRPRPFLSFFFLFPAAYNPPWLLNNPNSKVQLLNTTKNKNDQGE